MTLIDGKLPRKDCKRTFDSGGALCQYRESVKHKPLSNLTYPLSKKCTVRLTSPPALIQHRESGRCDSKTTGDQTYCLIQSHNAERLIHSLPESTSPTPRSCPPSEPSPTDRLPRTPDLLVGNSSWSLVTPASIISLDESMAGWSLTSGLQRQTPEEQYSIDASLFHWLRCPFCPKTCKGFATTQNLEKQMVSPVHCSKVYHRPTGISSEGQCSQPQKPPKLVSTLGALAQHLGSGACQRGKKASKKIVEFIERPLELLEVSIMPLLLTELQGK